MPGNGKLRPGKAGRELKNCLAQLVQSIPVLRPGGSLVRTEEERRAHEPRSGE